MHKMNIINMNTVGENYGLLLYVPGSKIFYLTYLWNVLKCTSIAENKSWNRDDWWIHPFLIAQRACCPVKWQWNSIFGNLYFFFLRRFLQKSHISRIDTISLSDLGWWRRRWRWIDSWSRHSFFGRLIPPFHHLQKVIL